MTYISKITALGSRRLRVELEDWSGESRWAEYGDFTVTDEIDNYRLGIGAYTGTAGKYKQESVILQ